MLAEICLMSILECKIVLFTGNNRKWAKHIESIGYERKYLKATKLGVIHKWGAALPERHNLKSKFHVCQMENCVFEESLENVHYYYGRHFRTAPYPILMIPSKIVIWRPQNVSHSVQTKLCFDLNFILISSYYASFPLGELLEHFSTLSKKK